MKIKVMATLIVSLSSSMTCFADADMNDHQLLVACNKKASSLVESFESELKNLKESRRLELLALVSDGCQGGYKAAKDGMQYKDIERYFTHDAASSDLPVGLILESVKSGYSLYEVEKNKAN